jgi:hypothetical protein
MEIPMKHGKLLTLEARDGIKGVDYEDDAKAGRVTATLRGKNSAKYTGLGDKLKQIEELQADIERLRLEVKEETRGMLADLFDATDAVFTRVVVTKSFIFRLNKDPKPTVTYENAKILAELEKKLTPSLIKVLTALREKYSKETAKSTALWYGKVSEADEEVAIDDEMVSFNKVIIAWAHRYDKELEHLQRAL